MNSAVATMISVMKQLKAMTTKDLSGKYGQSLIQASGEFAAAIAKHSPQIKQQLLQQVCDESHQLGLNYKAFITTTTYFGYQGGTSMFLPAGMYSFAPTKTPNVTYLKLYPNKSMQSCFVAKDYRLICYDGAINSSKQYKVESPGTKNLGWYGFSKITQSINIEPDIISTDQYDALQREAASYQVQLEYQKRQNRKLKNKLQDAQTGISGINDEIQDKEDELKMEQQKTGAYQQENQELAEQNELLIQESNENRLKSMVGSLENFESFQNQYQRNTMGTTVVLSALVVLLSLSMFQLLRAKN